MLLLITLMSAAGALAEINIVNENNEMIEKVPLTVDYSLFDDEDNDGILNKTVTLRILNTNDQQETVQVTLVGLPAGYSFRTSAAQVIIDPDQTQTVELTVSVPHEQDAGETKIGTIQIKQNAAIVDQADLTQDTKSMLLLDELKIEYRDEDDSSQSENACDEGDFC